MSEYDQEYEFEQVDYTRLMAVGNWCCDYNELLHTMDLGKLDVLGRLLGTWQPIFRGVLSREDYDRDNEMIGRLMLDLVSKFVEIEYGIPMGNHDRGFMLAVVWSGNHFFHMGLRAYATALVGCER